MPYYEVRRTVRYSVSAETDNEAVELVKQLPVPLNQQKHVHIIAAMEPEVYDEFVPGEQGVS